MMLPPLTVTLPAAGVILAAAFVLPHAAASPASVGAGTQPGPVYVTAVAGTTRTARVNVRDTGSAAETLTVLGGQPLGDQIVPFPWVREASVTTAPGIWRTVTFTMAVPADTAPGQFRRYVGAGASPAGNPGGAAFGATEFTDLVITVVPSASPRHDTPRNAHTTSTAPGA
jgi:hypothetical protein